MKILRKCVIIQNAANFEICFSTAEDRDEFQTEIRQEKDIDFPQNSIFEARLDRIYPYRITLSSEHLALLYEIYEPANNIIAPPFYVKTLRADSSAFFLDFIDGITHSPTQQIKHALRSELKSSYTVKGDGVHERSTKLPQYTAEQKSSFSKAQSTSYILPGVNQKLFGHDNRNKLVGVAIAPKDVLINRLFMYDRGTISRPYDFMNRTSAEAYYIQNFGTNLFNNLDDFSDAIRSDLTRHNEALARLRWNTDGSSNVMIYTDNLASRMSAQVLAKLLWLRIQERNHEFTTEQYTREFGTAQSEEYYPNIYFYPNDDISANNLSYYHPVKQAFDRGKVISIFEDPALENAIYENELFEYVIALPENSLYSFCMRQERRLLNNLLTQKHQHIASLTLKTLPNDIFMRMPIDTQLRRKMYSHYHLVDFFLQRKKLSLSTVFFDLLTTGSDLFFVIVDVLKKIKENNSFSTNEFNFHLNQESIESSIIKKIIHFGFNTFSTSNSLLTDLGRLSQITNLTETNDLIKAIYSRAMRGHPNITDIRGFQASLIRDILRGCDISFLEYLLSHRNPYCNSARLLLTQTIDIITDTRIQSRTDYSSIALVILNRMSVANLTRATLPNTLREKIYDNIELVQLLIVHNKLNVDEILNGIGSLQDDKALTIFKKIIGTSTLTPDFFEELLRKTILRDKRKIIKDGVMLNQRALGFIHSRRDIINQAGILPRRRLSLFMMYTQGLLAQENDRTECVSIVRTRLSINNFLSYFHEVPREIATKTYYIYLKLFKNQLLHLMLSESSHFRRTLLPLETQEVHLLRTRRFLPFLPINTRSYNIYQLLLKEETKEQGRVLLEREFITTDQQLTPYLAC